MLRHERENGITLVEVLVTVGVVSVLAAIVFVAGAPAREKARQSVCASQLRQLHAAVMMYSADVDAGEEIPGLGPFSCSVVRGGSKILTPYLKNRDVKFCPDLPSFLKPKIGSSYVWRPVPEDVIHNPLPGERGMLAEQRSLIEQIGQAFPMWICDIHDEVYYQPREAHIDLDLSQPFILEISVSGSVYAGRRPYRRSRILQGWAMLP
ncbi:MAG TPA: prepilin-type N-terminal cleavage/methylation domain-containing protein [Fimbriimonadaceae bacterium]|nr:prepilin-type N-terminal cleavage/methylation domain-containing protein [Fimbriimonadaceae bacterium]